MNGAGQLLAHVVVEHLRAAGLVEEREQFEPGERRLVAVARRRDQHSQSIVGLRSDHDPHRWLGSAGQRTMDQQSRRERQRLVLERHRHPTRGVVAQQRGEPLTLRDVRSIEVELEQLDQADLVQPRMLQTQRFPATAPHADRRSPTANVYRDDPLPNVGRARRRCPGRAVRAPATNGWSPAGPYSATIVRAARAWRLKNPTRIEPVAASDPAWSRVHSSASVRWTVQRSGASADDRRSVRAPRRSSRR